MNNISILSERTFQTWPSWDVVYEWEDEIANVLQCNITPLYPSPYGQVLSRLRKVLRKFGLTNREFKIGKNPEWKLAWIMDARIYQDYTFLNTIPIFLDFPVDMLDIISFATKKLPCFWVTSKDIYNLFIRKGCNNIYFEPLSVADKYVTNVSPIKDIDVIQFGRKNMILHDYMLKFCEAHKDVEYVYQTTDGSLTYVSTSRGIIGKFDSRREYMSLLSRCKVSLVSTPSIDNSKDFGGIDFVTPRFYESAANYCHMLGRFTENEESKLIYLDEVCENIYSYNQFADYLSTVLSVDCSNNVKKYEHFLNENKTSKRACSISKVLKDKLC